MRHQFWAQLDLHGRGLGWILFVLVGILLAMAHRAATAVTAGATGSGLIASLRDAGLYELVYGLALGAALVAVAAR